MHDRGISNRTWEVPANELHTSSSLTYPSGGQQRSRIAERTLDRPKRRPGQKSEGCWDRLQWPGGRTEMLAHQLAHVALRRRKAARARNDLTTTLSSCSSAAWASSASSPFLAATARAMCRRTVAAPFSHSPVLSTTIGTKTTP